MIYEVEIWSSKKGSPPMQTFYSNSFNMSVGDTINVGSNKYVIDEIEHDIYEDDDHDEMIDLVCVMVIKKSLFSIVKLFKHNLN